MNAKHNLIARHIRNLRTYHPGKPIEELAREKNLTRITKLASNENPLGPSPFAIREMTSALWSVHRYPDFHAFPLKRKICDYWKLDSKNIILGSGSEALLGYVVRAFVDEGQKVLTSQSTFLGFHIQAMSVGAEIEEVPLNSDFKYDVEAFKDHINESTKLIYIANPNNPTGTYITKSEFEYLMEYVPKDCIVLLDEAYFEFACHLPDYPDSMNYRYDNVITTRTFSKAHGLSGIRIGYGFAHEFLIENIAKLRQPFEPNSIAQAGAIGALEDHPHLTRTLQYNKELYQKTFRFLCEHGFKPIESVTNFIAFSVGSAAAGTAMFQALLDQGVIIRNLGNSGMPGFVRVSIGTHEEMDHYFSAMKDILPAWTKKLGRPA